MGKERLLSPAEERRLARRVRAGEPGAKDELIRRNLRLVVHTAKRYKGLGVDFEELVQEGTLGLIRAAEKYDHTRGYKFSTYATWWIRQATGRAVADKSRTIRIPVYYHERLRALRNAERRLTATLGREPTEEELARELQTGPEKVAQMLRARRSIVSLDAPAAPAGGEKGTEGGRDSPGLLSSLADPAEDEQEALRTVTADSDRARIGRGLRELPEPERYVLERRYGLAGESLWTLDELASELSTNREAIRKHQIRAEAKLREALTGARSP